MTVPATDMPRAVDVAFDADALVVTLADGRKATAPLDGFPRLKKATPEQRSLRRSPSRHFNWLLTFRKTKFRFDCHRHPRSTACGEGEWLPRKPR